MILSIGHAHGELCKHLGIDSNLFLNAYINRHAHTEYLNLVAFPDTPSLIQVRTSRRHSLKFFIHQSTLNSIYLSFYLYWFRSYMSITPGSANLETLII